MNMKNLKCIIYRIKVHIISLHCKVRGTICHIEKSSKISSDVRVILRRKGEIKIDANATLCKNSKIIIDMGKLLIGNNTCIGENCIFNCFETICIGNNVVTADNVSFITNTHNYEDVTKPINEQGGEFRPISIGDGSWIGINSTILDGTVIGKNCVVGAHSVVKGYFPDYCVIAGIPAKIIKRYDVSSKEWRRVSNKREGNHD